MFRMAGEDGGGGRASSSSRLMPRLLPAAAQVTSTTAASDRPRPRGSPYLLPVMGSPSCLGLLSGSGRGAGRYREGKQAGSTLVPRKWHLPAGACGTANNLQAGVAANGRTLAALGLPLSGPPLCCPAPLALPPRSPTWGTGARGDTSPFITAMRCCTSSSDSLRGFAVGWLRPAATAARYAASSAASSSSSSAASRAASSAGVTAPYS